MDDVGAALQAEAQRAPSTDSARTGLVGLSTAAPVATPAQGARGGGRTMVGALAMGAVLSALLVARSRLLAPVVSAGGSASDRDRAATRDRPAVAVGPRRARARSFTSGRNRPAHGVKRRSDLVCAATPCDLVYTGDPSGPSAEHLLTFLKADYKLERKIARVGTATLHVKLTPAP